MNKRKRSEKQIENDYDALAFDVVKELENGNITNKEASRKLAELKKNKDDTVISEAGTIPRLQVPKILKSIERGGGRGLL